MRDRERKIIIWKHLDILAQKWCLRPFSTLVRCSHTSLSHSLLFILLYLYLSVFSRSLPASSYISQNHFQQSSETCLDLSRLCVYMQVQTAPVIEGANGKTVRGPRWVKVRAAVLITWKTTCLLAVINDTVCGHCCWRRFVAVSQLWESKRWVA